MGQKRTGKDACVCVREINPFAVEKTLFSPLGQYVYLMTHGELVCSLSVNILLFKIYILRGKNSFLGVLACMGGYLVTFGIVASL